MAMYCSWCVLYIVYMYMGGAPWIPRPGAGALLDPPRGRACSWSKWRLMLCSSFYLSGWDKSGCSLTQDKYYDSWNFGGPDKREHTDSMSFYQVSMNHSLCSGFWICIVSHDICILFFYLSLIMFFMFILIARCYLCLPAGSPLLFSGGLVRTFCKQMF